MSADPSTQERGQSATDANANRCTVGRRWLVGIFLIALAARGTWGVVRALRSGDTSETSLEFPDEVDYWLLGDALADGDGLVGEHNFRALRMPLYPTLLAPLTRLDHGVMFARGVQWLIGAIGAVLCAMLACHIGRRTAGILAGIAFALDPFLVFFASLLLTETLFITLLVATLLIGWPLQYDAARSRVGRWLLLAVTMSAAIYTREAGGFFCSAWLLVIASRRRFSIPAIGGCAMAAVLVVASLLPWATRNARLTGDWCWLTHRAGISLYDGVGPGATGASNLGQIKFMQDLDALGEAEWNRYFLNQSFASIHDDPLRVARLALVKIARTWNPVPNVDTYQSRVIRLVSAAWTLPVYALAIVGIVVLARRDRGAVAVLLAPAVVVGVLHSVFVGSVRYRLPAMPFLEILAAVGLAWLVSLQTARPDRASASPQSP